MAALDYDRISIFLDKLPRAILSFIGVTTSAVLELWQPNYPNLFQRMDQPSLFEYRALLSKLPLSLHWRRCYCGTGIFDKRNF